MRIPFLILAVLFSLQAAANDESELFDLIDLEALAAKNSKAHIYRLHVSRSFDPELVFELEIWSNETNGKLFIKKARMEAIDGILTSTKLIKDSALRCDAEQIESFLRLIEPADIWTLPEECWTETLDLTIADGSCWTMEVIKDGKYRKLLRRSPPTMLSQLPDEIIGKIEPRRIFQEGILLSACVWLWVLGDESDEEIY